jgi:hypothetical protein
MAAVTAQNARGVSGIGAVPAKIRFGERRKEATLQLPPFGISALALDV